MHTFLVSGSKNGNSGQSFGGTRMPSSFSIQSSEKVFVVAWGNGNGIRPGGGASFITTASNLRSLDWYYGGYSGSGASDGRSSSAYSMTTGGSNFATSWIQFPNGGQPSTGGTGFPGYVEQLIIYPGGSNWYDNCVPGQRFGGWYNDTSQGTTSGSSIVSNSTSSPGANGVLVYWIT